MEIGVYTARDVGFTRRVETRRWNVGKSAFADCGRGIVPVSIGTGVDDRA